MSETKPVQALTLPTETNLPEGWMVCRLGEVVSSVKGKKPKNLVSDAQAGLIPYIDIRAFETGEYREYTFPDSAKVASKGDLLIVWDGARSGLVGTMPCEGAIGSTLAALHPLIIETDYLKQFLQLNYDFINSNTRGTGIPHVDPDILWSIDVPVAPLQEQKRIVAKVEVLLERVNAARERLARLPAILKRFRQSVLAAACSGKLTAEWREGKYVETTEQLLTRLRAASPTKSELCVEFPVKRWRVAAPRRPQLEHLPRIPETWDWVYLPNLGYMNRGRSKNRPRNAPHLYGGKYPFIQTGDIAQSGGRIISHKQTYSEAGLAQSRLWPAGTICITIAANIADTAILTYPACFPDSVVGLITDAELCIAEFAEYFIRTAREDLSQFAPATAQKNINIGILEEVAVPLPPRDEQREIVRRVEALFALADKIEANVRAATVRAERLPQAILARAFRGELVPTEAELAAKEGRDYEPASVLLERIQEARVQNKPAKREHGGKRMARRSTDRQALKKRRALDEVLREQGKPLTPERLFDLAGFDEDSVDGFYAELRKLIQLGKVRENRPNNKDVTLEAVGT